MTASESDSAESAVESGGFAQDPLLTAEGGIEKSFGRGWWPRRNRTPVLRGAQLVLHPGEVVAWSGRTVRASRR